MSDVPPSSGRRTAMPPGSQGRGSKAGRGAKAGRGSSAGRQVAVPGAPTTERRVGLLVLGVLLVAGAGAGFWYMLQSIDTRQEYVVTARALERWEIVNSSDFDFVVANVGTAAAMTPDQARSVIGLWATGRIPAGTLVTRGMFANPPLSSGDDAEQVLIEVSLPPSEAPFAAVATGDRLALIGVPPAAAVGGQSDAALIGLLTVEFVRPGGTLIYRVSPQEALDIEDTIAQYMQSADRRIWKVGFEVTREALVDVLGEVGIQSASLPGEEFAGGDQLEPTQEQ